MMQSRRDFLRAASVVTASLGGRLYPAETNAGAGWYDRPMRWAQLTLVENDPGAFDPSFWLDYFRRTHSDAACLSAGGCIAYYPTKIPFHHRSRWLGTSDPFGELVAGCRKLGMNVIARTDPHATQQDVYDAHPDWIAVDQAGNKRKHWADPEFWVTCALGPYNFEFMTEVTKEIVTLYKVDGVFSNRWDGSGMCYCEHCRQNFKAATGRDLPRTNNPQDPARRDYILWRQQRLFELWRLWDGEIRKINPNGSFIANAGGGALSSLDMRTIGELSHILFADRQARRGLMPPWMNGKNGKEYRSTMGRKPIGGIFSIGVEEPYRWKDSVQNAEEIKLWAAEGIANGLRPWFTKFSGTLRDHRWLKPVEEIYGWHYQNERYLRNEESLARVGLVYSQQTAWFYGGEQARAKVEDHTLGFYQALIEARIPFEMVHDGLLDPAHIGRFRTLILPNIAALSDGQCAQLREYVERGGRMVATHETSLYDEWGVRRADFGLATLFGASFGGRVEGPMQNSYLTIEKDPASGRHHPILKGLEDAERIINGVHRVVTKTPGYSPLTLVPSYPDLPMEEVFPRVPKTDIPEVFVQEFGRGRVVYFPWDIDRTFWEVLSTDHGKLLRNAVEWATDEEPPVTVIGHGVIDVTIWRQKQSMTVHLVNLTNPMMMKGPVHEIIPIGPLQVRIRVPSGATVTRVHTLVSRGERPFHVRDGFINVVVPSVGIHEVVAVDLAHPGAPGRSPARAESLAPLLYLLRPMRPILIGLLTAAALAGGVVDFTPAQRQYWAFQPVKRTEPPPVKNARLAATPIDRFILAKLESKGLKPNPQADRVTLIRRLSFDLIGLPPTPDEVDAFLADRSPNAYEKVVDRLLASPHYGERWARHWLDLARYAESEGFKSDETRPNAWRYRDYVIKAFNENKPYDRFVKEQIAGDELWPNDPDARVATAFNRHYPDESNARNLMQRRQEILDDITDTAGATFMAMTYGCARCHTHKFDPILHTDYYRLQAFFANTAADDEIPMVGPDEMARYRARKAIWDEKTKPTRDQIAALLEPEKQKQIKDLVDKYPAEIQAIIAKPAAERNPFEWQMYAKAKPYLIIDDATAARALKGQNKARYEALLAQLKPFAELDPGDPPIGIGMRDLGDKAPPTYRLAVGQWDAPQEKVEPGFLSILDPNPARIARPPDGGTTGRRTTLANWLTSPDNPLTARVMVNRIWFHHFGHGLVDTPSDFGQMGQRPTHPELLDWLASEFVRTGWDIKRMHKLMVMSNLYRESSAFDETAAAEDPKDRLMWRFPRERLEGEVIRDATLAVAGLLNDKIGGPSVYPELPEGAGKPRGGWKVSSDPADRNRRSVYIFIRRNSRYPMLEAFDMPDTHESCGRRNQTITAPQAMSLLNSKVSLEWAQAFAGRVLKTAGPDQSAGVDTAYRLAYGRHPSGAEKDVVRTFLAKQKQIVADGMASGQKIALPSSMPDGYDRASAAALVDFCQMLLNSNEFVYRN